MKLQLRNRSYSIASSVVSLLVLAASLATPALAQSEKDLIVQLQREMAQVQERIRILESVNTEGFNNLQSLLQQALERSGQLSEDMNGLETRLNESLTSQQGTVAQPVQEVRSKLDGVTNDIVGLREDVAAVSRRMTGLEDTIKEMSTAVREMAVAQAAPPPAVNQDVDLLIHGAERDLVSGKDDLAFATATTLLRDYPDSAQAPRAQFILGQIYDRAGQNEDAVKAFDAVLEMYPENASTADAMFYKALSLQKLGRDKDALATLDDFIDKYPLDPNVERARSIRYSLQ